ncbi:transcriptional repressor LexA [Geobacter sp. SVR]|uniref:transcriptional repressor LexA n=1 Tax=Geobacter sp. SVR TaxID=2495594 RepID=UPI00143EFC96|nr:transcriptional repressor LexA [Geobacter sp. SVR]BCS51856.1 LexA repressor 1 [Geobacter sp. SVR]GCF86957.1 LexA repressor 1 [Geobacter sp. SVR]
MIALTERQQKVLDFITRFTQTHGYSPTVRDIAAHLGVSSPSGVNRHLEALEKKGWLKKTGASRGIVLTSHGGQSVPLPIVGTVRAGHLQPAIEDIQGFFTVDQRQVKGDGCFFLRVKGDSMIGAGIFDGDLALVRPQPVAENRDTVVVMVDGEATLKWFHREPNRIRLQPANPNMEPIYVGPDKNVSIVGKVVGIYRQLE